MFFHVCPCRPSALRFTPLGITLFSCLRFLHLRHYAGDVIVGSDITRLELQLRRCFFQHLHWFYHSGRCVRGLLQVAQAFDQILLIRRGPVLPTLVDAVGSFVCGSFVCFNY